MEKDASLLKYNTLGVESTADELVHVQSISELFAASSLSGPKIYLGGGSNIVLRARVKAHVIKIQIEGISFKPLGNGTTMVRAGAGVSWHELVRATVGQGLVGLENLALIPGSVGAAPCQNISAYGRELSEVVHSVEVFDLHDKESRTIANSDCLFGYRDSVFKSGCRDRFVISHVNLILGASHLATDYKDVREHMKQWPAHALTGRAIAEWVVRIRKRKLPDVRQFGNVGSFFQNPTISSKQYDTLRSQTEISGFIQADGVRVPAARLIEACGWKGRRMGDVQVWHRQPLVLVNRGTAKGTDFLEVAKHIAFDVQKRFDVNLELEPIVLGENA